MYRLMITVFLFAAFIVGCSENSNDVNVYAGSIDDSLSVDTIFVAVDNKNIKYDGRIKFKNDRAIIYWPGSSAKIRFMGTGIEAFLDDGGKNYYNIIIDDSIFVLKPQAGKKWYSLASNLSEKEHSVEIFRRTEWVKGRTIFGGFRILPEGRLLPPRQSSMVIEFYGNSITAGYAIGDTIGDSPDGLFTNNYWTYGAVTARYFNADYYCIARGGIGITISWFPMIMDDMYYRLDPEDSNSRWDFSKVTPDIVVINLFQNDSWLVEMPDYEQFKARFGNTKPGDDFLINAYKEFLQKIRKIHPYTKIICTLGSMDATKNGSQWPGYIEKAVENMDDSDIYTCFFPYQNSDGHPEVKDHKKMADILIAFIENKLNIKR